MLKRCSFQKLCGGKISCDLFIPGVAVTASLCSIKITVYVINIPGIVESANKSDGSNRLVINHAFDYISDLRIHEKVAGGGGSQCSVDNGGCAHLCLAVPSTSARRNFKCACPTHYRLRSDNVSCAGTNWKPHYHNHTPTYCGVIT